MGWYVVKNAEGAEVRRLFAQNDEQLAANLAEGETCEAVETVIEDSAFEDEE